MKFILIIFTTIYLFAYQTTTIITTNSTKNAIIDKNIKKGLTGYVIHNKIMIAKVISLGNNKVKYLPLVKLKNEALATPNIIPKGGDEIIFNLYNKRGLIIAPNQNIYINIKKMNPNIKFINSDIFATYFTTKPTKEDFIKFCNEFNIGIIYFILDKKYIVDSNSFIILNEENIKTAPYKQPFFANYNKFTDSFFSSTPSNWIDYYKEMLKKAE